MVFQSISKAILIGGAVIVFSKGPLPIEGRVRYVAPAGAEVHHDLFDLQQVPYEICSRGCLPGYLLVMPDEYDHIEFISDGSCAVVIQPVGAAPEPVAWVRMIAR